MAAVVRMKLKRVELNRAKLDLVQLGLADGVFDLCVEILHVAVPPDAPPLNQGLVDRGGAVVYFDRKKVHETTTGGTSAVKKPRGSTGLRVGLVQGLVGFDFPALFQEFGTVHQPARPFFTPAAGRVIGSSAPITLSKAMKRRIGG